jgi:hypothetical protein
MRFGGNFHPDWGYLAPAPNFMRTARIVAVATAIGATAGAAVVLSLVDRPIPGPVADAPKALVVVHSLVQPAEAAAPAAPGAQPVAVATPAPTTQTAPQMQASVTPPPAAAPASAAQAPIQASAPSAPAPQATAKISAPVPSEAPAISTPTAPASVAALAESPPASEGMTSGGDAITIDTSAAANPAGGPKAALAPGTAPKKLPGAPATTAQPQAQHGPVTAPAKRKTAGDGLGPMLKRLFSAN